MNTIVIIIVFALSAFGYILLCSLVAQAAERKGRSHQAWFWIAFGFGVVVPAVIVAIIAPLQEQRASIGPGSRDASGQIPTASTASDEATSKADAIKKLAELRDQGILTDEEFNIEKAKVLGP